MIVEGIKSLFRFLPREKGFFDMFEALALNIQEGARQLQDLMQDFQGIEIKAHRIKDTEHKGDGITHDIILRVNKTFVTPIDREDIHALASTLDDVLDTIEAAAARIHLYKIEKPTKYASHFAEIILRSVEGIVQGLSKLRNFEPINKECIEINRLENEADQLLREAYVELFNGNQEAMTVLKWKDIYEALEAATDRCEDVANILEAITMKYG